MDSAHFQSRYFFPLFYLWRQQFRFWTQMCLNKKTWVKNKNIPMIQAHLLPVYFAVLDTDEVHIWCLLELFTLFTPNLRIVTFNSCCFCSFKWEPKSDLVQFSCKVGKNKKRCTWISHQVTCVFGQRDGDSWDVSQEGGCRRIQQYERGSPFL